MGLKPGDIVYTFFEQHDGGWIRGEVISYSNKERTSVRFDRLPIGYGFSLRDDTECYCVNHILIPEEIYNSGLFKAMCEESN